MAGAETEKRGDKDEWTLARIIHLPMKKIFLQSQGGFRECHWAVDKLKGEGRTMSIQNSSFQMHANIWAFALFKEAKCPPKGDSFLESHCPIWSAVKMPKLSHLK